MGPRRNSKRVRFFDSVMRKTRHENVLPNTLKNTSISKIKNGSYLQVRPIRFFAIANDKVQLAPGVSKALSAVVGFRLLVYLEIHERKYAKPVF